MARLLWVHMTNDHIVVDRYSVSTPTVCKNFPCNLQCYRKIWSGGEILFHSCKRYKGANGTLTSKTPQNTWTLSPVLLSNCLITFLQLGQGFLLENRYNLAILSRSRP